MFIVKLLAWILWKIKASVIVNTKIEHGKIQPLFMLKNAAYGSVADQMSFCDWNRVQTCRISFSYGCIDRVRVCWPCEIKAQLIENKTLLKLPHPIYTGVFPREG